MPAPRDSNPADALRRVREAIDWTTAALICATEPELSLRTWRALEAAYGHLCTAEMCIEDEGQLPDRPHVRLVDDVPF